MPPGLTLSLALLSCTPATLAFTVISSRQSAGRLGGGPAELVCQADSAWEYCSWKHGGTSCNLEWKRNQWAVVVTQCDPGLRARVTMAGNYTRHECGLAIELQQGDAGLWQCELEEYKLGDLIPGNRHQLNLTLEVEKITTTTTTTSTSTWPPSSIATDSTTTAQPQTQSTLAREISNKTAKVAAGADEAGEKVVVLPVAAEEQVDSSGPAGLVVATVLGLIAVIAVIGAAATLAFRRRRKSHREEIALEKNYDTLAANALLEEAEYHASIYTPPVHERPAPPPPI